MARPPVCSAYFYGMLTWRSCWRALYGIFGRLTLKDAFLSRYVWGVASAGVARTSKLG